MLLDECLKLNDLATLIVMNMFLTTSSAMVFAISVAFSFEASASEISIKKQSDAERVFAKASKTKSSNPWHFSNLYDDVSNSFFIPYHLWSGATWDGRKSVENCMHAVKKTWMFKRGEKERKQRVSAPVDFKKEGLAGEVKTFKSENRKNYQHYICHEKGLARIYDQRFEQTGELDSLDGKECKFPAGFGWQVNKTQDCSENSPKATRITELTFDKDFILKKMSYTYEKKKGAKALRKDDYYEYVPNRGRVLHQKLK